MSDYLINLHNVDHPEYPWIRFPMCCGDPTPETAPRTRPDGVGTDQIQGDLYCANCDTTLALIRYSKADAEARRVEIDEADALAVEKENEFWDAHYAAVNNLEVNGSDQTWRETRNISREDII